MLIFAVRSFFASILLGSSFARCCFEFVLGLGHIPRCECKIINMMGSTQSAFFCVRSLANAHQKMRVHRPRFILLRFRRACMC